MIGRPHYPSLDGLRCLAILPIVWHHATTQEYAGALGRGPLGVDLFFALSGFLITSLLLSEQRGLGVFWMRRSLRIFPLYYAVLGAFVVHALWVREPGPVRTYFLESVPYYATYTSNLFRWEPVDHPIVFAFAWSLAAEEQFYSWWPIVVKFLRRRAAFVMLGVVVLDQAAERGWLPVSGFTLNALRSFATPIGLGALLAIGAPHLKMPRWGSASALALIVVAVVKPWPLLPTQVLLTVLVGACALRSDHWLAPVFENRVVRHIGVVSYGIYLLNVPVVTAVKHVLHGDGVVFLVSAIACVVAATITRHVIELPFLRLRSQEFASGTRGPLEKPWSST
jgi:peptidoglycan/LPS O-acetylase OafA/YrhL